MEKISKKFLLWDKTKKKIIIVRSKFKINNEFYALCPKHPDKKPSLTINVNKGVFFCHACFFRGRIFTSEKEKKVPIKKIEGVYRYTDENGNLLYEIIRYVPKSFKARRLSKTGWVYNLKGVPRVLYNLPTLVNAPLNEVVIIVEGEKKVEHLKKLGFVATCNPFGALKWLPQFNQYFYQRKVCIIPDNDVTGFTHAKIVYQNLRGIAKEVKVLTLPNLKPKQDILDWLKKYTPEDLKKRIKNLFPIQFPSYSIQTAISVLDEINIKSPNIFKLLLTVFNTILGTYVKNFEELKKELSEPEILSYFLSNYCRVKTRKKFQKERIKNDKLYPY